MKNQVQTLHSAIAVFLLIAAVGVSACQSDSASPERAVAKTNTQGQAGVQDDTSDPNILQIAMGSPDHTTLAAAIQAGGLENVLVSAGPLTVFAPTNAAFDALPAGTVEELLKPENKSTLASIVTSHASPGTFKGDLLKDGTKIYLATGQYVDVEVRDGETYVYGAKILGTVDATNGVVHVVDKVFLFPKN